MQRLHQLKLSAASGEEQGLLQEAMELYTQLSGSIRGNLAFAIDQYSMAQDSGEPIAIRQATKYLEALVQFIKEQASADPLRFLQNMEDSEEWDEMEFEEDEADE